MRLYEITPDNNTWRILHGNSALQITQIYLQTANIFDRLNQGFNFTDNTEIWNNKIDEFNKNYTAGVEFLDSFPDQTDPFVEIHRAQFKSCEMRMNEITEKLKQLRKIS
jgi:hypothetical protein